MNISKSADDDKQNPNCPRCGKEITTSVAFNNRDFQPICLPCVTKALKAKGRKNAR